MDLSPATAPVSPLPGRRHFFRWLTYALGGVATLILGAPVVGFFLGVRKKTIEWVTLGDVKSFFGEPSDETPQEPGERTRLVSFDNPLRKPWDGITAKTDVFVRFEGQIEKENDEAKKYKFQVFAVNCAHLGCPVSWFPQSGLFMCPCHGGVYYANGERASGPPPRGLYQCVWKVEGGKLLIQAPHYPTLQDTLGGDKVT